MALLQTESTGKHSMNKAREGERERERVSVEEEKPAAERRHTLSPAGSENRDDSVCVHVCTASSDITLRLLLMLLLLLLVSSWFPLSLLSPSF